MKEEKIGKVIKGLANEIGRFVGYRINDSETNFTMNQFQFIAYIGRQAKQGPLYQRDLEAYFNIRRSTASGILQRLEKNNFITRTTIASDGRLKQIELTESGRLIFKQKKEQLDEINNFLIQDIPLAQLDTFYQVIDQVYTNINMDQEFNRNEDENL